MKAKNTFSLFIGTVLAVSAGSVLAQDDEIPMIAGVPVTTAVAVGIVGATIIGAAIDDDDNEDDAVSPPPETTPETPPVTTPMTTPSTTSTTSTGG